MTTGGPVRDILHGKEIERLQAENARLRKEAATSTAAFMRQCGDLDRLRLLVATLKDECRGRAANEDRLRNALANKEGK